MASSSLPQGEIAPHKAAATFDTATQAQQCADRIRVKLGLGAAQVRVVTPESERPGRALEPEPRGIFATMLRAHAALGAAGLLGGIVLYYILYAMGIRFIVASPFLSAAIIIPFVAVGAMMFAGLVTLRPDHDLFILQVQQACREGRSATVVHARTADELAAARAELEAAGGQVVTTL